MLLKLFMVIQYWMLFEHFFCKNWLDITLFYHLILSLLLNCEIGTNLLQECVFASRNVCLSHLCSLESWQTSFGKINRVGRVRQVSLCAFYTGPCRLQNVKSVNCWNICYRFIPTALRMINNSCIIQNARNQNNFFKSFFSLNSCSNKIGMAEN